jgi:7,8-dihydropterin-6-yl-methyl-4-(beta-D-ribofuranosyl)aminobenzene 5'-phosphate synthase
MTIPLQPVEAVTITILVENLFNIFMPDQGPATRSAPGSTTGRLDAAMMLDRVVPDQLVAEHGFSVLLEVTRGEGTHQLLFDLGVTPHGMVENMRRLDIDPKDVEAVVCSHGHFDHVSGLEGLAQRLGRRNLPVVIHPQFWNRRRAVFPGRQPLELPTPSRAALEGIGFTIVEGAQPSFLLDGSVLVTGEVPRVTDYEPGFPFQEAWRVDHWEPDPLVLDDQAVVINVRDHGLVVITGCGHAGVVNTARHAKALTGEDRICAIVGGFHLSGLFFERLIARVCDDLLGLHPAWIVPGHCTGWRAQVALSRLFGESCVPSCVGTRLRFGT